MEFVALLVRSQYVPGMDSDGPAAEGKVQMRRRIEEGIDALRQLRRQTEEAHLQVLVFSRLTSILCSLFRNEEQKE